MKTAKAKFYVQSIRQNNPNTRTVSLTSAQLFWDASYSGGSIEIVLQDKETWGAFEVGKYVNLTVESAED
ncbi:MAG: hypothetical protein WC683_03945 [bacterium]